MTDATERARTAVHEAGHHVIAAAFGWRLGPVTVEPGAAAYGCSVAAPPLVAVAADVDYTAPFVCWPHEVRRRMEGEALVYLAGDVAEVLFARRVGRGPESVSVRAAGLVAELERPVDLSGLPPATAEERTAVAAACDNPAGLSDADRVARLAGFAHDHDPAAAGAWIAYMDAECRALLLANERRVQRLAAVLAVVGTVSGEAAARLIA